ncbi:ABC transporter ATP-binding protein [Haloarchaeobius sp. TZWSO28]|uniref:ABC transporter ATP-binding protein n=1 Tax=Haloarchaeobius sp. TZWSO28 TaxID=3446119 RepID=UPI003EB78BDB
MTETVLETRGLVKDFGGITATNDVSVSFSDDELHAIIGPNGAGKTTFFNLLTGTLTPTEGSIHFLGEDITALSPDEIAQRGLIRSYQVTQLFENLTVLENVRIAAQSRHNSYDLWHDADSLVEPRERAESVLDRLGLLHKRDVIAAELSHGEQRVLELAIALGTDPKLLLLDEPTAGMSPEETAEMIHIIDDIAERVPIVLVEHKMSVVMEVADRILVLHNGRAIADDTPAAVRNNDEVKRVYLGEA